MCAKLLVAGGNGFIGSEICRMAVEQGHDVIGLSRHGRPEGDADWMERVRWESGNILMPEDWRHLLQDCDAVVHTVAMEPDEEEKGVTYESLYRDSVEMLGWEAEHAGVERFVCISSAAKPPFTSDRYLAAKRDGEAFLRGRNFRESILRPAYVYGPDQPTSMVLGPMMKTMVHVPGLRRSMRTLRPLRVEQVAAAALRAATEPGYEGVIDVDNIAYLAEGHWEARTNGNGREEKTRVVQRDVRQFRPSNRTAAIGLAVLGVVGGATWALLAQRRHAARKAHSLKYNLKSYLPWT